MDTDFLKDYDLDKLKQFIEEHMDTCKQLIHAGFFKNFDGKKYEEEQYQIYSEILEILYILDLEKDRIYGKGQ